MAEPSKEALELAEALWEQARYRNGDPASIIAAALQKFMDERDEARRVARVLTDANLHTDEAVGRAAAAALRYPEVPHG